MFHVPEECRMLTHPKLGTDASAGNNGVFVLYYRAGNGKKEELHAIASDDKDWPAELGLLKWEHVSVSTQNHIPTWDQMCFVKNLFWDVEDSVIQFHPPKSRYVNQYQNCLHLWRPIGFTIPLPPIKCI